MPNPNEMNQPMPGQPGSGQPQQGKADPEQQDLYDIFVAQGIKLASATAQKLQGKASVDLLGNALYEIVTKIEAEGEKNGVKFPPQVMLHGSGEILDHLVKMSQVDITEEQVSAVVGIAVGKYMDRAAKSGKVSQEDLAQLAQQSQQQGAPVSPPAGTGPQGLATPQGGM